MTTTGPEPSRHVLNCFLAVKLKFSMMKKPGLVLMMMEIIWISFPNYYLMMRMFTNVGTVCPLGEHMVCQRQTKTEERKQDDMGTEKQT